MASAVAQVQAVALVITVSVLELVALVVQVASVLAQVAVSAVVVAVLVMVASLPIRIRVVALAVVAVADFLVVGQIAHKTFSVVAVLSPMALAVSAMQLMPSTPHLATQPKTRSVANLRAKVATVLVLVVSVA